MEEPMREASAELKEALHSQLQFNNNNNNNGSPYRPPPPSSSTLSTTLVPSKQQQNGATKYVGENSVVILANRTLGFPQHLPPDMPVYSTLYPMDQYRYNAYIEYYYPGSLGSRLDAYKRDREAIASETRSVLDACQKRIGDVTNSQRRAQELVADWEEILLQRMEDADLERLSIAEGDTKEAIKRKEEAKRLVEEHRREREEARVFRRSPQAWIRMESLRLKNIDKGLSHSASVPVGRRRQVLTEEERKGHRKSSSGSSDAPSTPSSSLQISAVAASPAPASPTLTSREQLREEGRKRFEERRRKMQMERNTSPSSSPAPSPYPSVATSNYSSPYAPRQSPPSSTISTTPTTPIPSSLSNTPAQPVAPKNTMALHGLITHLFQKSQQSQQAQQFQKQYHRAALFAVSLEKAKEMFTTWRESQWAAPAGFSKMVEHPSYTLTWVPYYRMRVTAISEFSATLGEPLVPLGSTSSTGITPPSSGSTTPRGSAGQSTNSAPLYSSSDATRQRKWREVHLTREKTHTDITLCAAAETDSRFFGKVQDWNLDNAIPLQEVEEIVRKEGHASESAPAKVEVRNTILPSELWRLVEREVGEREKNDGRLELLTKYARAGGATSADVELKDLVVQSTQFKGNAAFNIVYVPLFVVRFGYNDHNYTFLVNGQSGSSFGERPYEAGATSIHAAEGQQQQPSQPSNSTKPAGRK